MSEQFKPPLPEHNYGSSLQEATDNHLHGVYKNNQPALIDGVPELIKNPAQSNTEAYPFFGYQAEGSPDKRFTETPKPERQNTDKAGRAHRAGRYIGHVMAKRRRSKESTEKFTHTDLYDDMENLRKESGLFTSGTKMKIEHEDRLKVLDEVDRMKHEGYPKESIDILKRGAFKGRELADVDDFVRGGRNTLNVRRYLANMYAEHPSTAEIFINKDIVGAHGTRASALPSILKKGALLSARMVRQNGTAHTTGEHFYQNAEGQDSISFTTLADISSAMQFAGRIDTPALSQEELENSIQSDIDLLDRHLAERDWQKWYAESLNTRKEELGRILTSVRENPDSLETEMLKNDFPVVFAISKDGALEGAEEKAAHWNPKQNTQSSQGEFRAAREEIGLDELVIAVPEDKIELVKSMYKQFGRKYTAIVPLEDLLDDNYKRIYA